MGLLRNRGEGGPVHYQMREKLIAFGDDYWIEDSNGEKTYKVNGKALRIRDTWILEDRNGNEVAKIRERKLSVRDAIKIECHGHDAVVKKKIVSVRDRFHIELDGGEDLEAHGRITDHEYEIEQGGHKVAEVSKRWFRVRDTYGVEISPNVDPALILSITVAIDAMSHD